MQSPTEKTLDTWISALRRDAILTEEAVKPYEYTFEGRQKLGKEVTKRHIKMAVFGNVIQISLCSFLAAYMFPHRAFSIMAFSVYLGCVYAWYVLAKRRFKKKWGLIEKLESEAEEWQKTLSTNKDYLERINPIIDKHRKLFSINNYHALKDILVDGNTGTEDGKHFFLTRGTVDKTIFNPNQTINHTDLVCAINDVARNRILNPEKSSWTHQSPGSVNLVTNPIYDSFMDTFDVILSRIIESVNKITNTAPEVKGNSNQDSEESEFSDNVVNLFAHRKTIDPAKRLSPHQECFVELTRLTGVLVDIIDPLIQRSRFQTVDLESEKAYLDQVKLKLEALDEEVEKATARALSVSGASAQ